MCHLVKMSLSVQLLTSEPVLSCVASPFQWCLLSLFPTEDPSTSTWHFPHNLHSTQTVETCNHKFPLLFIALWVSSMNWFTCGLQRECLQHPRQEQTETLASGTFSDSRFLLPAPHFTLSSSLLHVALYHKKTKPEQRYIYNVLHIWQHLPAEFSLFFAQLLPVLFCLFIRCPLLWVLCPHWRVATRQSGHEFWHKTFIWGTFKALMFLFYCKHLIDKICLWSTNDCRTRV